MKPKPLGKGNGMEKDPSSSDFFYEASAGNNDEDDEGDITEHHLNKNNNDNENKSDDEDSPHIADALGPLSYHLQEGKGGSTTNETMSTAPNSLSTAVDDQPEPQHSQQQQLSPQHDQQQAPDNINLGEQEKEEAKGEPLSITPDATSQEPMEDRDAALVVTTAEAGVGTAADVVINDTKKEAEDDVVEHNHDDNNIIKDLDEEDLPAFADALGPLSYQLHEENEGGPVAASETMSTAVNSQSVAMDEQSEQQHDQQGQPDKLNLAENGKVEAEDVPPTTAPNTTLQEPMEGEDTATTAEAGVGAAPQAETEDPKTEDAENESYDNSMIRVNPGEFGFTEINDEAPPNVSKDAGQDVRPGEIGFTEMNDEAPPGVDVDAKAYGLPAELAVRESSSDAAAAVAAASGTTTEPTIVVPAEWETIRPFGVANNNNESLYDEEICFAIGDAAKEFLESQEPNDSDDTNGSNVGEEDEYDLEKNKENSFNDREDNTSKPKQQLYGSRRRRRQRCGPGYVCGLVVAVLIVIATTLAVLQVETGMFGGSSSPSSEGDYASLPPNLNGYYWTSFGNNADNEGSVLRGTEADQRLGDSLAISGSGHVVATRSLSPTTGTVMVVVAQYDFGGDTWVLKGKSEILPAASAGDVGAHLAMDAVGNRIVVGAPSNNTIDSNQKGQILTYDFQDDQWLGSSTLTGETPHYGDHFDMSSDGQTLLVGEPDFKDSSGRVQLFSWDGSTREWSLIWTRTGNAGQRLGSSVKMAVHGNSFAVSATHYSHSQKPSTGAVFVWKLESYSLIGQGPVLGTNSQQQLGQQVAFSVDGKIVASTDASGTIHAHKLTNVSDSGGSRSVWRHNGNIYPSLASPFGGFALRTYQDYISILVTFVTCCSLPASGYVRTYNYTFHEKDGPLWDQQGDDMFEIAPTMNSLGLSLALTPDTLEPFMAVGAPGYIVKGRENAGIVQLFRFTSRP